MFRILLYLGIACTRVARPVRSGLAVLLQQQDESPSGFEVVLLRGRSVSGFQPKTVDAIPVPGALHQAKVWMAFGKLG